MTKPSETHFKGSFSDDNPSQWLPRLESSSKELAIEKWLRDIEKTKGPVELMKATRWICQKDLFWLCKRVLGYSDLVEPLHDDMCDFLGTVMKQRLNSLTLIPRAHFKSTIATIGRAIQEVIKNKNVRIGLCSGNMKNARKFATEIRNHMESNAILRGIFPDIFWENPRKQAKLWTQDEFTVIRDPKVEARLKEGTIKIFGLLQNIPTGDHFDVIIADDLIDQEIVGSEDQMAKVEENLQYLIPLQQTPQDPIHLVGTRYHIQDIYGKLIEKQKYKVYLRRAIENGTPIFPERFDKEMLDATRVDIGNYKYYCQYDMNPQDPGDKKFKMEWLKEYGRSKIPIEKESRPYYELFMMVDPANKHKKESDFTAIGIYAVDHEWNVYLIDGLHDKLNPKERIDAVFDFVNKWKLHTVGYETIAFQETDVFWIKRKQVETNCYFQILEINHRKQNKFDYIMSTQPIYQSGRFFLPKEGIMYQRLWENPDDGFAREVDICDVFRRQYDFFPNIEHDDMLDNVAMAINTTTGGRIPRPEKPPEYHSAYPKAPKDDYDYRAN